MAIAPAIIREELYRPAVTAFRKGTATFKSKAFETIDVLVLGDDYLHAAVWSAHRWSNTKPGYYGGGLINSDSDPHYAERVGLLGEMAFAKLFGLGVNLGYVEFGDEYDFALKNGKTVDVKTATHFFPVGLVMAITEKGREIPLEKDIYVFSYLKEEDRKKQFAVVSFIGFCTKKELQGCPINKGRAKNSTHQNYEVDHAALHSLDILLP